MLYAVGVPDLYAGVLPPTPKVLDAMRSLGATALADAKRVAEQSGATGVDTVIRDGTSAVVLRDASRTARMMVVGASGHGRFMASVALGSTANQLATHAACPVVVVSRARASAG